MTAAAVSKDSNSGSDERALLREAIAGAAEAQRRLAEYEAAISKARELIDESNVRFDSAVAALSAAKQQHAKAIAEHAAGGKQSSAGSAIKAAREAREEAEDTYEAASGALKELESRELAMTVSAWRAKAEIEVAIGALLSTPASDLLKKARTLEKDFMLCRAVLHVLVEDPDILRRVPDELESFRYRERLDQVFAPAVRADIKRFLNVDFRQQDQATLAKAREAATRWRQTIVDLRSNPDTALPD